MKTLTYGKTLERVLRRDESFFFIKEITKNSGMRLIRWRIEPNERVLLECIGTGVRRAIPKLELKCCLFEGLVGKKTRIFEMDINQNIKF